MPDRDIRNTRFINRLIEGVFDITGAHGSGELPADDIARVVIQYRGQVIPTPANHFKIGKIRLPQLVDTLGRGMKRITGR